MIKRFRHKGLARYFEKGDRRGIDTAHAPKISRILDALDQAASPEQLNIPGWRLHPLTGDRKGTWSISVSGNWRITFEFSGTDAVNVNLEDYH
ncbi:MAG: type II toxin-antitoxin system RelE/ParE family toxin [Burkholderiales bacterium]